MRHNWLGIAVWGVLAVGGATVLAAEADQVAGPPARGAAPVNRGSGAAPAAPRQTAPASAKAPAPPAAPVQKPNPTPAPRPAAPVATGARDANGQPIDANKANEQRDGQPRANVERRRHRHPGFFIPPTHVYAWSPYTWWYGSSYWGPPVDGYGGDEDGARTDDSIPTTPVPPNTDTPTQEQAKALNDLEANPDYRAVVAALKQAEADYASASARVTDRLKKDPEYQALVEERDRAKDQVEAAQAAAKIPNPDQVTPAAQRKLDIKSEVTRMEQDAIAADPQAREAKTKVAELNARVTALRQQARGTG